MANTPLSFCAVLKGFFVACAAVMVLSSTSVAESLMYTVELKKEQVAIESVGAASSFRVNAEGYDHLNEEGLPALPYRIVSILMPQGHEMVSWEFTSGKADLLAAGISIETAPPMISEQGTRGVAPPMASWSIGETAYPEAPVRYLGTGYLHGRGIASFAVFPVRIKSGSLQLNPAVDIHVTTQPAGAGAGIVVRERYREGFERRVDKELARHVVNPEINSRYVDTSVRVPRRTQAFLPTPYPSLEGSPVDYLIVTTDALQAEYQRLADFKTNKGVPTVVRTVSWITANTKNGVDVQETIRNFVRDAYAKWGITYLLLGGDTDIMPARHAFSAFYLSGLELPVDMYFGCLDGTWNEDHDAVFGEGFNVVPIDSPDLYSEVYNGRIPISDLADVEAMIDKIINYETAANRGYMDKHLLLGEVLFPVGWKPGDPISLNGADFFEFMLNIAIPNTAMAITKMYETEELYPGAVDENKAAVLDSLNSGYDHVAHIGHGFRFNMSVGDLSILNTDADMLTNDGKFFNLYMLNCTAAAYDYFCLAEHFLQNHHGGAVSVIGANESAFPNASSNYMNEYHRLVFEEDVVHIGEAFARSRLPRTPVAETADNVDLWSHYIYSILSDPELPLFNGPVDTLSVFHVSSVGLGTSNILVNVTDSGSPVDSAVVCMTKGEDDYETVATNSLGNAIIEFTTESPGSILVVVTGLNYARHESYITVNPSANAYVSFSSLIVDDDSLGGSAGNGDGVIDAGETVDFTIEVTNTGGAPSDSVWFKLRSDDVNVTVFDSIGEVGVVGADDTAMSVDGVRVQFDPGIADEHAVQFDLIIEEAGGALVAGAYVAGGPWNDSFSKEVHTPELELVRLRIDDDPPLGNGDGILQFNEEFKLYVEFKNFGTGVANGLVTAIQDLDDAFVFIDSVDSYADILPFTSAENSSGFHLSEGNTVVENHFELTITDNYSRTLTDTLELRFPGPASNLTFDTSLGTDRLEIDWDLSGSPDVAYYDVYQSLTPGGPYTRVNTDPVVHGMFVDTGLAAITAYYYIVTAIDSSGNASFPSSEASASTNPPQMAGFPILLGDQTTSDPAIGDIDGDGDKEIVVGNSHVNAWHHDSNEMQDGDSDPQTWGTLNTVGGEITSSIALANLDNVLGLDIIACDLDSAWVMCMRYDGTLLPGWPKQALNNFRSPPTAGDITGDGLPDVIAVDHTGLIYAWDRYGNEIRDGDSNPATDGVFFDANTTAFGFHSQGVALADLDGDSKLEIIFGSRDHNVYALNEDGSAVPGWPFLMPGEAVGSPAVGDIDNDGLPEVVVRSRSTEVYLLNHDATVWGLGWPRFVSINEPFFGPSFALADFDNDDDLEIVIVHMNTIESRLYVVQHNGSNMPGWPIVYNPNDNTESSPVVADVDGNGTPDIILGDESRFIYAWDINANMIAGFPIATQDAVRATPALDDVDGDGDIDMVVYGWDQRVYLYDLGAPYDPAVAPWPTFQGGVVRDGMAGSKTPTGIAGVAFSFSVQRGNVSLTWIFSGESGERFSVMRSLADENGQPIADFVALAEDVAADRSGVLRYADGSVEMGERYVYRLESVDNPGDEFTSGLVYIPITSAELHQNFPNPFNPTTSIEYLVPEVGPAQHVALIVYDVSGARVRTLVNEKKVSGRFKVEWDGRDDKGNPVSTGIYFYRLQTTGFSASKKMLLLK